MCTGWCGYSGLRKLFLVLSQDTEFPGIVARPTSNALDYNYRTVKYNVDLLKVIQLGLTFADSRGCLAEGTCTWQFNFRFDLNEDMYAQNSIDFLKQSGIDFDKQQKKGVDVHEFGELIMNSGLVMNEDVKWISFHGCYDFGYLLKLVTCEALPESEHAFFDLIQDFFPSLYDIKFLLRDLPTFDLSQGSSLQKVSEHLNVERVGPQHQAGSDSLVTCRTFFSLVESYFDGKIDEGKFSGFIYGLGCTGHKPHRGLHGGLNSSQSQEAVGLTDAHQELGGSNGCISGVGHSSTNRHVSAGPPGRVGQQQQGAWASVSAGRASSGLPTRQRPQGPRSLPGLADNGGAVLSGEGGNRLRGLPAHSGTAPGGPRAFGTELHRTGSAPPAPLLCGSGEGRLWTGPTGTGTGNGSSVGAASGEPAQPSQSESGSFSFDGNGSGGGLHPAGNDRRR